MDFLTGIPTEVLTGLGSSVIGGALKIMAQKQALEEMRTQALMHAADKADALATSASTRGGSWARRTMALLAAFFVFGVPSIHGIAQIFGITPFTTYLYSQQGGGFWIFGGREQLFSAVVTGFVITPLHTHLASAVFFFYFGAGVVKHK